MTHCSIQFDNRSVVTLAARVFLYAPEIKFSLYKFVLSSMAGQSNAIKNIPLEMGNKKDRIIIMHKLLHA